MPERATGRVRRPGRVLVLGLDGATFRVIRPMMALGRLPHLSALSKAGASGLLPSVFPVNSAVAWNTFATGKGPGKHGVFGFTRTELGTYRRRPVISRDRKARTFWQLASDAGLRCCVVNVPLTYPPEPLNGVMVSGFPRPDRKDYVCPASMLPDVEEGLGGVSILKSSPGFAQPEAKEDLLEELRRVTGAQARLLRHLMAKEPWDVLVTVFDATDVAGHFLWGAPGTTSSPDLLYDAYDVVDEAVGEVLAMADKDDLVLVLSDHGFGPSRLIMDANLWLLRRGYMRLKRSPGSWVRKTMFERGTSMWAIYNVARKLRVLGPPTHGRSDQSKRMGLARMFALSFNDVDWKRTRAYSFNKGGELFVNLEGREPLGSVAPKGYAALVEELKRDLREIQDPDNGRPLFDNVLSRGEVFAGQHMDDAPDVVFYDKEMECSTYSPFDFGFGRLFMSRSPSAGAHHIDGVLIASGPGVAPGSSLDGVKLADLAPTLLQVLGLPALSGMDGEPIPAIAGRRAQETVDEGEMDSVRIAARRLKGRGL